MNQSLPSVQNDVCAVCVCPCVCVSGRICAYVYILMSIYCVSVRDNVCGVSVYISV